MKERFKILKKELNKLIKEKRKVFNNNNMNELQIIEKEEKNFDTKEKNKNNDIFYFLELKYNTLNNALKKLSILLQNQINENNNDDNYIEYIKDTKENVKNELFNYEKNLENNLQNIYNNYIENFNLGNNNEKIKEENNSENNNKIKSVINLLDKSKKKEENNFIKIKKDMNGKIEKINLEIKNERNKINIWNNPNIKKYFENINNEIDKGKS